jgi:protease I
MNEEKRFSGKSIAILVANGFAELEMTDTQKVLVAEGARTKIISPEVGIANGWHEGTWGHNFFVESKPGDVLPSQYDALLIPGGQRHVATLLGNAHARRIVKGMMDLNKPIGLFGEAVEILIGSQTIAGRTVAAIPALTEKVTEADATASEEGVVVDGKLITARGYAEVAPFITAFVDALESGSDEARQAA